MLAVVGVGKGGVMLVALVGLWESAYCCGGGDGDFNGCADDKAYKRVLTLVVTIKTILMTVLIVVVLI